MTSLKGDLRSIMGTPFGGVGHAVLIFSRVTRAAFNSDSVVLQLHDRIEMPEEANGKFQVDGLDPGPIRIELEGGTVHNHGWNIDLPDEGVWSLTDLVDAQVDWSPAVIGRAEAAAREARDHADRAEAGADRVGTAEQVGVWASEASSSASAAASARSGAVTARDAAQSARDAAEGHANRAATSESNAAASESAAKQSETNAGDFAAVATTAATEAVDAMDSVSDIIGAKYATQEYVDTSLGDVENLVTQSNQSLDSLKGRVEYLEPQRADGGEETAWAHTTPEGERLPLGYSKDGRLDSHARKIIQEDTVGTFDFPHDPVYARLSTTSKGDILWGVHWDGTVEIPKLETSTGGESGSPLATRLVPLAFTLPGGSSTTSGAKSLRIIREYAHFPGRVRVHVSNRHPMSGNAGSDVTLTGSTIGVGAATGEVSKAQVLFSANTVIPAGEEVVSRWVTLSGSDGDGLAISLAWSGDTVRLFKAGCWTNSDPAAFNNTNTAGWAWNSDSPLYIWVEADMPARIPAVMANGDSISVGSVTDNPVSDAWVAMYAREHHALPVFASWHGSSMPQWAPDIGQWGRLYPGVSVRPDAIVMALGQNDLNQDVNLDALKSRYNSVRDVYDSLFPGVPVYVGTVNASNKPSDKEALRRQFNTWLSGLPRGERGVLDFASALDDPTGEFLLPEYTSDELHPNTAGQTAMAGVVLETPISPYVLTTAQMKGL